MTNAIVNSVETTNFVKLSNVPNGSSGLASFRGQSDLLVVVETKMVHPTRMTN